jgi:hypothetical protein
VLLVDVHALDDDFVEFGIDLLDGPDFAFVIARENDHLITFFDVHDLSPYKTSMAREMIFI